MKALRIALAAITCSAVGCGSSSQATAPAELVVSNSATETVTAVDENMPRMGMYNCSFYDLSRESDNYNYPCVLSYAANGEVTLEKLRGFARFSGKIRGATERSFDFVGSFTFGWDNVDKERPTMLTFTAAKLAYDSQDYYLGTDEKKVENVQLQFLREALNMVATTTGPTNSARAWLAIATDAPRHSQAG